MKTFNFRFDIDVCINADEIWPDGDVPENPTAEDVMAIVKKSVGVSTNRELSDYQNLQILEYWNLHDGTKLEIREMPEFKKPSKEEIEKMYKLTEEKENKND